MTDAPTQQTFTLHQRIEASPERVFKAWTDPEQISRWFVPVDGWSAPLEQIAVDTTPGGQWRVTMVDDKGESFPAVFHYREVSEPNRIVFTTGSPDQDPDDPNIGIASVTIEARDGGTEMTYEGVTTDPDLGEAEGWKAMFERLADQLASG